MQSALKFPSKSISPQAGTRWDQRLDKLVQSDLEPNQSIKRSLLIFSGPLTQTKMARSTFASSYALSQWLHVAASKTSYDGLTACMTWTRMATSPKKRCLKLYRCAEINGYTYSETFLSILQMPGRKSTRIRQGWSQTNYFYIMYFAKQ